MRVSIEKWKSVTIWQEEGRKRRSSENAQVERCDFVISKRGNVWTERSMFEKAQLNEPAALTILIKSSVGRCRMAFPALFLPDGCQLPVKLLLLKFKEKIWLLCTASCL